MERNRRHHAGGRAYAHARDDYDHDYDRGRGNGGRRSAGSPRHGEPGMVDEGTGTHYRGGRRRLTTPYGYERGSGGGLTEYPTTDGPHAGKGPKGYRRSDEHIHEEVCQHLQRHGHVDASDIEVSCEDGIVTLKGTVENRRAKRDAEQCAEEVYGVEDVMNELRVDKGFLTRAFGIEEERKRQSQRGSRNEP